MRQRYGADIEEPLKALDRQNRTATIAVGVASPRLGSVSITAAKRRAPSSSSRQVKMGPEALRKVSCPWWRVTAKCALNC